MAAIDDGSEPGAWADHIASTASYPQLRTAHDIIEDAEAMPNPVLANEYATALYARGYEDARKERDYDPCGTEEWQVVYDALRRAAEREQRLSALVTSQGIRLMAADDDAARVAELEAALAWYGEQAQRIRGWQAGTIASMGGVYALQDDGGERANAALAGKQEGE